MSEPPKKLKGGDLLQWQRLLELAGDEKKAWEAWERWKCRTSLFYLASEVYGLKSVRRGRRPLLDPVFHKWLCSVLEPDDDLLLLVPRNFLKTSMLKIRIIQAIIKNPYVRIGLLSLTTTLSRMTLRSIVQMAADQRLRRIFPDLIPAPGKKYTGWEMANADAMTIYRPPRDATPPQEPQISVYGIDSTTTGLHFDWWVGDDILNEETVRSPLMLEKTEEWYRHARGKLDPEGWQTYIGTHYHHLDLYMKMRREGDFKRVYVRGAVENGKPIYRFFTLEMLEKYRKQMGDYIFACQMMNDPIPRADRLFPPPQPMYDELPAQRYRWYLTVDPAATTKMYSDETAMVLCGVSEIGIVYVEEAIHFKKPGDEIARMILNFNEKYRLDGIGIELGLQEHLMVIIRMVTETYEKLVQHKINLPIVGVKIDPGKGKYDRFNVTLGSFVRSGKLKINARLTDLMQQMEFITPNYRGKDDLVDALSMVFSIVKQFSFHQWQMPTGTLTKDWTTWEELFGKKKDHEGWENRFAV